MPISKKSTTGLDGYFSSKRFVARLDKERQRTADRSDLLIYAFRVKEMLKLKNKHFTIIYSYLLTGKYNKGIGKPTIRITDGATLLAKAAEEVQQGHETSDDYTVFIEVDSEITKEEFISLIDKNWKQIKSHLEEQNPDRMKRFIEPQSIETKLTITEELGKYPIGSSERHKMALDLSAEYGIDLSDIYDIVAKYGPFIGD